MPDSRIFFKIDVGYFRNPKIMTLLDECPDAVLLHLSAIAYAREHLTDGVVQMRRVMADVLVDPCGSQCGSHCEPQCARMLLAKNDLITPIDKRTALVHDYAKHNQTRADVEKASAAARKGAQSRWDAKRNADRNADRIANRNADRTAKGNADRNAEESREEKNYARARVRAREGRFDEFWDTYPRKVGKGAAVKAWAKAVKDTDPDDILNGLTRQLPGLRSSEERFVPHPSTWLNACRWDDEPSTPTSNPDDRDPWANVPLVR